MRIDILQHVDFEGPGLIKDWVDQNHHHMVIHRLDQNVSLPHLSELTFLIILGGPMSANDPRSAWLEHERLLIKQVIEKGIPVLGICLGAQQIAKALGATIFKGKDREAGWFPVTNTDLREEMIVFHWHQDQFELPKGAELLYNNAVCPNQGFRYHSHVLALQFHFESNAAGIKALVDNDSAFLDGSRYTQSAEQILKSPVPAINKARLFMWLDQLSKYA
ncbi:type 1 glutamine amidotransferase [Amphibacillus jilinensis]|uniref:type 1 glutamine amidotransferase n=1 Tax=Amphibacillus jilinensis TaxID=1216008 RepID=UPI0002E2EC9A|nr:type 1 glutamine amidotransferase [Amphibacillus jilinensis]